MVEITPQKPKLNNIEWFKDNLRGYYHFLAAFAVIGIAFAAMNFNNPPLFNSLDNFVLFASEEIKIEKDMQVSSGDLGSNKELDIEKDAIINGNLFADEITIDKNTTINGNISFNKLKAHKETQILGTQTKPVSLPIANLPEITEFSIGTQDFKFKGQDNTLTAGNYRDLILEKDSRLVLSGGTYNLRKLELKENSTFIFNSPTTLNIKKEFKGQEHISILPGNNNLKPTDLVINYQGKNENGEQDRDDKDKNQDKEKEGGVKPIEFGKNSFLNFKLLAPKANVQVGEDSTIRGQILARKVKVGKDGVVSREVIFSKDTDPNKIITVEGETFSVNEMVVVLRDNTKFSDAQGIANLVNGRIIGFIPELQIYKIEVLTSTAGELSDLINMLENQQNPLILFVIKNLSGGLQ